MGEHCIARHGKPPRHIPFTPDELHLRAVERQQQAKALRMLGIPVDNRAPHANRGTPPRKHYPRPVKVISKIVVKNPEKYLHSSARARVERPMTGFLATLTDEQRAAILEYRGDDILGDPSVIERAA